MNDFSKNLFMSDFSKIFSFVMFPKQFVGKMFPNPIVENVSKIVKNNVPRTSVPLGFMSFV